MQKNLILLALLLLSASASAEVQIGVNLGGGGPEFYAQIGDYYHVPEAQIQLYHSRRVPDEELPVVYYLAGQSHASPEFIVNQRLAGRSWMDISLGLHLSPAIFYVPFDGAPDPAYAHGYSAFRHYPRNRWNQVRLRDDDIVNFVNLRFVSDHYGYRPEEVMHMRGQGHHFSEFRRRGPEPHHEVKAMRRPEEHREEHRVQHRVEKRVDKKPKHSKAEHDDKHGDRHDDHHDDRDNNH